ncbi:putative inner membrane protein [Salmonella enterica subsp. arizonae]|uniref:Putative inner membrane protein n=1 Tax=Salmonella enterica subsp. arizonae TaxID=59203 RepID=A0A379T355_SALER|nr:putative inner membrane protein [Salmonella enterica subsp. arizonae]
MSKRRGLTVVLATLVTFFLSATPVLANPGNGNGGGHGNNAANQGNNGNGHKGNARQKTERFKNGGKPDHVESDISYAVARQLAVNLGLTGYQSLPPGIAKIWREESRCRQASLKKGYQRLCWDNYLIIRAMSGKSLGITWC